MTGGCKGEGMVQGVWYRWRGGRRGGGRGVVVGWLQHHPAAVLWLVLVMEVLDHLTCDRWE
jgi:hypothetical protein